MNLADGLEIARSEFDMPSGSYIFVNDDLEMFACNMRPSLQDGYWGNNIKGFMTEYLGVYDGGLQWTKTLRAV